MAGRGRAPRTELLILGAIVAAAIALRFATLWIKSYWEDEGLTLELLHRGFGPMLHELRATQPDPPLYFSLAWVWVRVVGYGEFALRSLSAFAGVLTIPITYAAGRRLVGERGALIAAALLAFNPLLVWYSQEARPYALLGMLVALSLLLLVRALERPDQGRVLSWVACCIVMLATHYFAIFIITAEAVWLVWAARGVASPGMQALVVCLTVTGAAFTLIQAETGPAKSLNFGGTSALPSEVLALPGALLSGFEAPQRKLLAIASAALVILAMFRLLRFGSPRQRRGALIAGSIGAVMVGLPVAAAVVGQNYLLPRNVIGALPPLSIAVGAGFAAGSRSRRTSTVVPAAALTALGLAAVLVTVRTPKYHYQDWRAVAAAMGSTQQGRAVVLAPRGGSDALAYYLPRGLRNLQGTSGPVAEVDVVVTRSVSDGQTTYPWPPAPLRPVVAPAPGFGLLAVVRRPAFTLERFTASSPRRLDGSIARAAAFARALSEVLLEPGARSANDPAGG